MFKTELKVSKLSVELLVAWTVRCGPIKRHTLLFPYLHDILTDFQNFFTGTLSGELAIKVTIDVSAHRNCVAVLPCKIPMLQKLVIGNNPIGKRIGHFGLRSQ